MAKIKHLINFRGMSGKEIEDIIDNAIFIKKNQNKFSKVLENKSLAMLYQKTSTRTRISLELAMKQLGGHTIFLDWNTTQLGITDIGIEAKAISRYVDIFAARLKKNSDLLVMAKDSEVPMINLCDEKYHPTQILADLMTIKEKFGRLKGLKLTYLGIGNNISNSLTEGCTKVGIKFTLCVPEHHSPSLDKGLIDDAIKTGNYKEEKNPKKAILDADIVYTDSWIDMELMADSKFEKENKRRLNLLIPYQINKDLMKDSKALIMHNMSIHPGYEITKEMVFDKRSIIFDQAENRLHVNKAILLNLLRKI